MRLLPSTGPPQFTIRSCNSHKAPALQGDIKIAEYKLKNQLNKDKTKSIIFIETYHEISRTELLKRSWVTTSGLFSAVTWREKIQNWLDMNDLRINITHEFPP